MDQIFKIVALDSPTCGRGASKRSDSLTVLPGGITEFCERGSRTKKFCWLRVVEKIDSKQPKCIPTLTFRPLVRQIWALAGHSSQVNLSVPLSLNRTLFFYFLSFFFSFFCTYWRNPTGCRSFLVCRDSSVDAKIKFLTQGIDARGSRFYVKE